MNILLADDNLMFRNLLEEFLGSLNHITMSAEDGLKALDLYQSKNAMIDLVITDIMMPGINGIELTKRIRDHDPLLPIIIISGYAETAIIQDAKTLNATIYEKPVDLKLLRSHIGSLKIKP